MSITQLAFQAVVAQNLIEENDYKVHNLKVTNELTRKTIGDIWDTINGGIGGDIVERIEVLEDKTYNITHNGDTTSITNILNVNHVTWLSAVDVDIAITGETLTYGPNPNVNSSIGYPIRFQADSINYIMCSDDPSVVCPVNGVLTSISFALTGNYSYKSDYNGNLIIATGKIIDNVYMETDSLNISTVFIPSMSIYTNSELNIKIKVNDVVFKGSTQKETVYSALKRSGSNIKFNDPCYIVSYDTKTYLGSQTMS
jgi:hypothetical protein